MCLLWEYIISDVTVVRLRLKLFQMWEKLVAIA